MHLFFCFIISLTLVGCGILKQSKEPDHYSELRKNHKDPLHVYSCGPNALQKAFQRLGISISLKSLSHTIQKDFKFNTLVRDFLAVFENRARKITFPEEMLYILKENGFKVSRVKGYENLNKITDTAIVLIKQKGTLNYHWMCFPVDEDILSFFGKDTVLKEIYLINK